MAEHPALEPGGTIGILGGGQLGRMLAQAANAMGLNSHIYCPDPASPAFAVTPHRSIAGYDDEAALARFAQSCDVITYEFENIPVSTVAALQNLRPVLPGLAALNVAQDRLSEKTFISALGIGVPRFAPIDRLGDLTREIATIGLPCIVKTRRLGYDGKGQFVLRDADDAVRAFETIGEAPAILEALVPFSCEISVLVARGRDGAIAIYDPPRNEHREQILRRSHVPAGIDDALAAEARAIGRKIAEALNYVGVLAVELFVVETDGTPRLLVNEIAPRVHNSGHWTMDACLTSQFAQHIRAVAGWPLGATERHSDAVMENLIGMEAADWRPALRQPGAALHLYGKSDMRPGRKMGHINHIFPRGAGTGRS